jgi:hypothetical protein
MNMAFSFVNGVAFCRSALHLFVASFVVSFVASFVGSGVDKVYDKAHDKVPFENSLCMVSRRR